jgi:hypothetical protein
MRYAELLYKQNFISGGAFSIGGVTNPLRKAKQATLQMQFGKRLKSKVKG